MRYVAFLRGINVSGQKLIKMDALKQHFEIPAFKNIVTYIQSGNILFDTKKTDEAILRRKIEQQLFLRLGYDVPAIVRSIDNIKSVIANNPFNNLAPDDERNVYVSFLSSIPDEALIPSLNAFKNAEEELRIIDREGYLLVKSYGNTKLSNALIEKKLKVTATTRNWATINKMLEL